jgi:hypothetical protein
MSSPETELLGAIELLESKLGEAGALRDFDPALVQRLNAVAVRMYAGLGGTVGAPTAFPDASGATVPPAASDVCFTVTQMLDAVSVEIFELAMWKSWNPAQEQAPGLPGADE